jgi:hypothetical protein
MVSVVFTAFRNLNIESLYRLAKPSPSIGNKNCFGKRASLQLRVLRLCFFQDGDVGVGVFPEGEEVLVGGFRFGGVA